MLGFGTGNLGQPVTGFEKHTFLVVDDEAFSRSMVQSMLKRLGAQEVYTAGSGEEAISALNRLPITVMITDFHMPGIHGLRLLKDVRSGQTRAPRNLICAMLTGHAVRHLVGLAIVLDVDSFLAKPVAPDTLVKHLARAFQHRFDPLPAESYEKIDVANADRFVTGTIATVAPIPPQHDPLVDDGWLPPLTLVNSDRLTEADLLVDGDPLADPAPLPDPGPATAAPERKPAAAPKAEPARPRAAPPPAPAKSKAKPRPPRSVILKPEPKSTAGRSLMSKSAGKASLKDAVKVALSEVPERAVLARNIMGSSGTLLLAAGTPFRGRYVRRLQELSDIEGEISHVWIYPP